MDGFGHTCPPNPGFENNPFLSEEGAKKAKHASSEDDGHDDDENDYEYFSDQDKNYENSENSFDDYDDSTLNSNDKYVCS